MMDMARAHVFIAGRVQGVNFRASARNYAREVGVSGWVRNLEDGRVEAVFEGERSAVQKIPARHDGVHRLEMVRRHR
jgi:acylphosphatase